VQVGDDGFINGDQRLINVGVKGLLRIEMRCCGLKWRMSFLCIVDANYIRENEQRRVRIGG